MKPGAPIVRRLREHDAREDGPQARMGGLIRSMKEPQRLSGEAHARISRRLRLAGARRWEWLWMMGRPALAVLVVVSIVSLGLGARAEIARVFQASISWIRVPAHAARTERTDTPAPAPNTIGARPHVDPPALAQESRLLATALDQLRTSHDYPGALATLTEYDARFPEGALRSEAALARLDALTALGQSAAALRRLDQMDIGGPRATEMFVLRGELRANSGRYQDAIADFERSLTGRPARALRERALYGRASCRSRTGDVAGARRDLEDYQARFPDGPHAAEVRQHLPPRPPD